MAEESVAHKTARTSFWAAIEKLSTLGVQFVISMLLARLLTPSDYGTVAMLGIVIAIGNQFISCGFGTAIVRKPSIEQKDLSTAFFFNLGVSLLVYLIIFFTAPLIAKFYELPILNPILRVYGLTLIISSAAIVQQSLLSRRLDFKSQAKVTVLATIVSGIVGVFCAYKGLGAWALVIQSIVSALLNTFLLWFFLKWTPSLEFSRSSLKYLWGFGSKVLASGLISSVYTNLYSLFIGKVYNSAALGLFNKGQQIANIYPDIVRNIFIKNSVPILAQHQDNHDDLKRIYSEFCKLVCFVTFPVVVLAIVLAKPFVLFFLTERWIESVPYVQIFSVAAILGPLNIINYNILLVVGRSDATLKAELIKKISGIAVILILLKYGPLTLAIGSCCFNIAVYFINLLFAKKYVHISIMDQFKDLLPSLLIASLTGVVAYFVICFIDGNLLQLIVGALIGVGLYFIVTKYIFRFQIYNKLSILLKRQTK